MGTISEEVTQERRLVAAAGTLAIAQLGIIGFAAAQTDEAKPTAT